MALLNPDRERGLFKVVVLVATLVPIIAGAAGVLTGPEMIKGVATGSPDLDSHFRYLSGLLLGIGFGFAVCVVNLERRAALFRALAFIVVLGGLGRLLGAALNGLPTTPHRFAFVMELLVVPLLIVWLNRIERIGKSG
jgi:hypothetical protein